MTAKQASSPSVLQRQIEQYVADNPDLYREDLASTANRVFFQPGGDVIAHAAAPHLLERTRYQALCSDARLLVSALDKVVAGYRSDGRIRRFFAHLEAYRAFLELPVLTRSHVPIARFDLLEHVDGSFQIIEPNTCCPGGQIWTSMFYASYARTHLARFIGSLTDVTPTPIQRGDAIYDFLRAEHARVFGARDDLRIVAADTTSAVMDAEVHDLCAGGRLRGIDYQKRSIQDIRFEAGEARIAGRRVDIVHQFLDVLFKGDLAQIAANYDEIDGYLAAARHQSVMLVNPFPPIFISEDKSVLALLRDPGFADLFSADELGAIARLVPETYHLRSRTVVHRGERTDLTSLLVKRKDDFVIKAQMESRGRDIMIGREVDPSTWERKVRETEGGMYVAQVFVPTHPHRIPRADGDPIALNATLAIFLFSGESQGLYSRLAPSLVTNVARGGAWQEVLIHG